MSAPTSGRAGFAGASVCVVNVKRVVTRLRLRLRLGLVLVVALSFAQVAQVALADGDPASDTLISQHVFLPLTVHYSLGDAGRLTRLLDDSRQKGFPLKVAVIARRADLGAIPSLFGQPRRYARFLGQEDFYFFKDELLVVMPQGYGIYKHAGVPAADRAAVARLRRPAGADGNSLVAAAENAVRALAARHGLELSAGSSSSHWRDRIEIIAGVLVLGALLLVVRTLLRPR